MVYIDLWVEYSWGTVVNVGPKCGTGSPSSLHHATERKGKETNLKHQVGIQKKIEKKSLFHHPTVEKKNVSTVFLLHSQMTTVDILDIVFNPSNQLKVWMGGWGMGWSCWFFFFFLCLLQDDRNVLPFSGCNFSLGKRANWRRTGATTNSNLHGSFTHII